MPRIYDRQHRCQPATGPQTPWHLLCQAMVLLENLDIGLLRYTFTEQSLRFGSFQDLTSVQLRQCQHMPEDVGCSKARAVASVTCREYEEWRVWVCWTLGCLTARPASHPDGCLIHPEEKSWNPESDSGAWEQSGKWRPVSLIKTTMHFHSVLIKF